MKQATRIVAAAVACLSMLASASAFAQDTVAAEALFDEGLAKMKAGAYEAACPALAESYRLEPAAGTLFTLAECERRAGAVASASAHYRDYLRLLKRLPEDQQERQVRRKVIATQALEELEPLVPRLTILMPENAPPGTTVTRDGSPLGTPALGKSLPIDPGEHTLVLQLSSGAEKTVSFRLTKGERKVIMLELPAEPTEPDDSAAEPPPPAAPPPPATSVGHDRQHKIGPLEWTLGGLGVVGVGVGAATGIMALSKKSEVDDHCAGGVCENSTDVDAADTGKLLGTASTVGFAVGGACLVTATILVVRGKPSREQANVRPLMGLTSNGGIIGAMGRW